MGYDMVKHDLQAKIADTLSAYHRTPAVAEPLAAAVPAADE
jgi:hypothetical protein